MSVDKDTSSNFLRAWAWKREHRVRFHKPYIHKVWIGDKERILSIAQKPFKAEGFASTVWDSSIVVAKFLEKQQLDLKGKLLLDLSAGCGLPGLVASILGAHSIATDLEENVEFLKANYVQNGAVNFKVSSYTWGARLKGPLQEEQVLDYIIGCDLMYIEEEVNSLVQTLLQLAAPTTQIIIAHGRNRQAEGRFLEAAQQSFSISDVASEELDSVYQCTDVRVLRLMRHSTRM